MLDATETRVHPLQRSMRMIGESIASIRVVTLDPPLASLCLPSEPFPT